MCQAATMLGQQWKRNREVWWNATLRRYTRNIHTQMTLLNILKDTESTNVKFAVAL